MTYLNGLWTFVDADDVSWVFNTSGQLQTITYRDGYKQTLSWSSNLNTGVTDSLGRSLTFAYNASRLRKNQLA